MSTMQERAARAIRDAYAQDVAPGVDPDSVGDVIEWTNEATAVLAVVAEDVAGIAGVILAFMEAAGVGDAWSSDDLAEAVAAYIRGDQP